MLALYVDSMAWVPYSKELERKLVVESRFDGFVPLTVDKVEDGVHLLGIPRELCSKAVDDRRIDGAPIEANCNLPPRDKEQARVISEAKGYLDRDLSYIIQATTGFGKTFVASSLIAHRKVTTLIIVTKEDLMQQWRAELKKFLGFSDDDIGVAQQNVCDYQGKKVVLGMVHSLAKDKYGQDFYRYFGMVITDEVHRMGAETFNRTCSMFPAKIRIGLSATVKRVDGKTPVFTAHIGKVLVSSSLVQLPPKVLVKNTGTVLPKRIRVDPGRMMPVYKFLASEPKRNRIIVKFIVKAYGKGRHIIVFSDLREAHLNILYHQTLEFIPENDMAFYVGGLTEAQRDRAKTKRVIFATYAMAAEATDIPRLDTAVFATPRANIAQPLGRILRIHPDKAEPLLLDLVDEGSQFFEIFFRKRAQTYHKLNASIAHV